MSNTEKYEINIVAINIFSKYNIKAVNRILVYKTTWEGQDDIKYIVL